MKLYRFTVGMDEKFYPFENEKEAYDRRKEVDHTFEWLPVMIEEIKIEGYTITVHSETEEVEEAPKNKGGRPRKA